MVRRKKKRGGLDCCGLNCVVTPIPNDPNEDERKQERVGRVSPGASHHDPHHDRHHDDLRDQPWGNQQNSWDEKKPFENTQSRENPHPRENPHSRENPHPRESPHPRENASHRENTNPRENTLPPGNTHLVAHEHDDSSANVTPQGDPNEYLLYLASKDEVEELRKEQEELKKEQETINIRIREMKKANKKLRDRQMLAGDIEDNELGGLASACLGQFVHYLCAIILTIFTFPWNLGMICYPRTKCAQGVAKTLMALSILLNLFIICGPYHIAQDYRQKDFILTVSSRKDFILTELERCAVVLAVCYALISFGTFSYLLSWRERNDALHLTLLDFLGTKYSPRIMRDYDLQFRPLRVCGLSETNFYFLKLSSTLNFLMAFSGGLFYALIAEIVHIRKRPLDRYTEYSTALQFALAGGAIALWYLIMKMIVQSLISTFRNFEFLRPLLPDEPKNDDKKEAKTGNKVRKHKKHKRDRSR